jgi:hypothetical protein
VARPGTFQKGHPRYGGRQKGLPGVGKDARKVKPIKQRIEELLGEEIKFTPLQVMHAVMHVRLERNDLDGALTAAEKAAPYCHAKLAMTDVRVKHSNTDRSDSDIATEIANLRAKLNAARALPAPPVNIDVLLAPAEPEPVTVDVDSGAAGT